MTESRSPARGGVSEVIAFDHDADYQGKRSVLARCSGLVRV